MEEICANDERIPYVPPVTRVLQWSEEEDMIADMEIQALMRVGARRRNRWFNERILRELAAEVKLEHLYPSLTGDICRAGPMDAQDMHAQYTPPPFGVPAPPSIIATAIVRAPRPTCSRLLVPLTT
eukprot:8091303-Pyramimonas_sp.AAC.1